VLELQLLDNGLSVVSSSGRSANRNLLPVAIFGKIVRSYLCVSGPRAS